MKHILSLTLLSMLYSCTPPTPPYKTFDDYPAASETSLWNVYTKEATEFKIWSPTAQNVKLNLYEKGSEGKPFNVHHLEAGENGVWFKNVEGNLHGTYYTYQVKINGKWLAETPGIYAQAVGVNGNRAMVIDLESTNPEKWAQDKGPALTTPNEAIIYELHVRDLTVHPQSGSSFPGKFSGLVESGTRGPEGVATGLDHIKELGITHVHLLPAFDYHSVDETRLDSPEFNWGYDPQNYNVPEGSYSSDPHRAEVRIREFKEMVKTFHDNRIGVILDLVYNHTGLTESSNFNLEVPGYYYRQREDGTYSDAAACGNETASERAMMRTYILESVTYWMTEYHLDGFRFDLMGIHDIATMNEVATKLKAINPNVLLYGEGWTAGDSPLPLEQRALKQHMTRMPQVSAFSDDLRDGLKGSVFDDSSTGFVSGAEKTEESIKFGVVGSIQHPQVKYDSVNYSKAPWTNDPWQAISYVSCHDNHTLYDKLRISCPDAKQDELAAMDKLANAIVLTSQGTAFIHAGEELLRTKKGSHNSYNLPDSINQIDWNWKVANRTVFEYYKNLIALRKAHPAFRMISGDQVRENLEFKRVELGIVSYQISGNANGDEWKNILVIYNARKSPIRYELKGTWNLAVEGDSFYKKLKPVKGKLIVPAISMMVLYQTSL